MKTVLWSRIEHFLSIRIRIQGFDHQKLLSFTAGKNHIFNITTCIYRNYSYALIQDVQATVEASKLKPSKDSTQHFFFFLCESFFPTGIRIRIHKTEDVYLPSGLVWIRNRNTVYNYHNLGHASVFF